jgi:hypothetical protein
VAAAQLDRLHAELFSGNRRCQSGGTA